MAMLEFLLCMIPCISLVVPSLQQPLTQQSQSHFFAQMKASLSGSSMSQWTTPLRREADHDYCNYAGVACDAEGNAVQIDISAWSVSGRFPDGICSSLHRLRVLRLGHNDLSSGFPVGVLNCSFLEELNLTASNLAGGVPDLSRLKSLRVLDLSHNKFSGAFPLSVTNLTNLQVLSLYDNRGFSVWQLPEEIARLTNLKRLLLMACSLHGRIPEWIGNMTSLVDLELSRNFLSGPIPAELGKLKNLQFLELYFNQLTGRIPEELGHLAEMQDLDISQNRLTGEIPASVCRLPNLRALQLYNNSLTGEIPREIGSSTSLAILSLYQNFLEGELPPDIGNYTDLVGVDVSENHLSGRLPEEVCRHGKLLYFLALDNQFSGKLPENYARCRTLLRFRVSENKLSGPIPEALLGLPHASIIDLSYNLLRGMFPKSIAGAKNLSELYLQSNRVSGSLPSQISGAANLVKIDLSNNLLSGPIPEQVGDLKKLNLLLLQGNKLSSSIPQSLSSLKYLNVLNLSSNLLTGEIPESLCELLPNSLDFSNNLLSGPVPLPLIEGGLAQSYSGNPHLCSSVSSNSSIPLCFRPQTPRRQKIKTIWVIAAASLAAAVGFILYIKRRCSRESAAVRQNSFSLTSFCKLGASQDEIVKALVDQNVIGRGGSGTVYKIELGNGQPFAVKRLRAKKEDPSLDQPAADWEVKAEVETLGRIRHKNIVKLVCCFSSWDSNLLVYEYVPNGNLWDMLHRGKGLLDWPARHEIAVGVAQGLAYLHHDLLPPIIHRDIKPTNILLDAELQPKVADFGVAKVLQAGGNDPTATVVAGTYGYLAPEYAYSSKATVKCDVYSFGVVLMELVTGKKPIDPEFGENRNIISWVPKKAATKDGVTDVLDKRLSASFKDEMIRVLEVAIHCTSSIPANRPTMNEVVQLLIEANPCRFDAFKSWDRLKEEESPTMKG